MQLIEIAKALCYESKLLILDEPTATLTSKEVERLFEILRQLKAQGVTILYISHRLHEIFEIGDRVTVLRDGQLVATRPLAGLTIPEIVRMMVGRSMEEEHAFREDVVVSGEALRVEGLRRNAKTPGGVASRVRQGRDCRRRGPRRQRPDRDGAGHLRRRSEDRRRDLCRGRSRSRSRPPKDAVRHGLCLMTEDRKGQGLLLGMSCAENITITDLSEDFAPRHSRARRRAERGDAAGRGAPHQDAVDRPAGAQFLRRQPAEGRHRQVAVSRFEGPPLRRADARHRRRRARRKSTISCGRWPRKAGASSSSRPTCRS